MTIEKLQECIAELYTDRGFDASPSTLCLGIMEEVGELAMALLLTECKDFKPSPRKLTPEWSQMRDPAREVGDIIVYLLALCNRLEIKPYFKNKYLAESIEEYE